MWWAMSFNAVGASGAACAADQVCFTCVCRGCAPPVCLMEHMGIWGSESCLLALAAGNPTFPFPQRNVAAPGHYSSAVTFSLVLAGR